MSPSQVGRLCARDLARIASRTVGWLFESEPLVSDVSESDGVSDGASGDESCDESGDESGDESQCSRGMRRRMKTRICDIAHRAGLSLIN